MWRPFVPFTPLPLFDAHDSITQPCWYQSILISPNYHGLNTLAVPANSRSIECWVKCGSCILAFTWHMFALIRFTCLTFFHHCHYVANNRTDVCVCCLEWPADLLQYSGCCLRCHLPGSNSKQIREWFRQMFLGLHKRLALLCVVFKNKCLFLSWRPGQADRHSRLVVSLGYLNKESILSLSWQTCMLKGKVHPKINSVIISNTKRWKNVHIGWN